MIILEIDKQTAIDLCNLIYDVGEHTAAGAPITPRTIGEIDRIRAVYDKLMDGIKKHRGSYG